MKYEIWSFTDDYGGTWHLEQVDGPNSNYEAFQRHVKLQTLEAKMRHEFYAKDETEAQAFFQRWMDMGPNES